MTTLTRNGTDGRSSGLAWAGVASLAVALLAGCSSKESTSPVTGKVTLDGAAVSAGSVLFLSDDGKAAGAPLGADGSYKLQCRPGKFKVAVSPPPPPDPLASPGPAKTQAGPTIPQQYQDVGTSGLTTEVKAGPNTFDIALKSKP